MNKFYKTVGAIALAASLVGCGSNGEEGANHPDGSVTIMPTALTIATPGSAGLVAQAEPFVVLVRSGDGTPLAHVRVRITWADLIMDFPGTTVLSSTGLYDTFTDAAGKVEFSIVVDSGSSGANLGLNYTTDLGVFSGPIFQKATVTVTCVDTQTASATTCD